MKFSECFIPKIVNSVDNEQKNIYKNFQALDYKDKDKLYFEYFNKIFKVLGREFPNYYSKLVYSLFLDHKQFSNLLITEVGNEVDPHTREYINDLYVEANRKDLLSKFNSEYSVETKCLQLYNLGREFQYQIFYLYWNDFKARYAINKLANQVIALWHSTGAVWVNLDIDSRLEDDFYYWLDAENKLADHNGGKEYRDKVEKTKVTNLEGNNQAIMLNIINKLRQRGNVTKQELEQFFNKYDNTQITAKLVNAEYYNQQAMVSPDGQIYPTESHPDWANENYKKFNIDFHPVTTQEDPHGLFDKEERTGLDHFFDAGWIRVKTNQGIEMEGLHSIPLVKKILTDMAHGNEGRYLTVDDHNGTIMVFVNYRGKPDFSKLDQRAGAI